MKLIEAFYLNMANCPDRIVIEDKNRTCTISELDYLSAQVYRYLVNQGIGTEDVVAISLPRGIYIPVVMLGVIKAGAAFVVIGERAGKTDADFFIKDSGAICVITPELFDEILKLPPLSGNREPKPHDLACIVYSSGSTGYFKGSMHEYGQYDRLCERVNMFPEYEAEYGPLCHERVALVQGLYAIDGTLSALTTFAVGRYLDIVPYEVTCDCDLFREELIGKHITATILSPVQFKRDGLWDEVELEYAYVAFEMYDNVFSTEIPLYNGYGQTESFLDLCNFRIDRPYDITPVGPSFDDVDMFLVDSQGEKVADGTIGEIYVKTEFFRGYRNRPLDTERVFSREYIRTGDMAVMNDGNYIILGRKIDLPLTTYGYIIPCKVAVEVKKALNLEWCYVKCFDEGSVICAYTTEQVKVSVEELRSMLFDKLPDYMLPTHIVKLDSVDYFTSGKTNRYAFNPPR